MNEYEKTGYLNTNFKMFHLTDTKKKEFSYHYHDFNKILIFLSGDVTYTIEGRSYDLKPNDVVFVNAGEVHRPVIHSDAAYERIIIYVSPDFLQSYQSENTDLNLCFKKAHEEQSHVLRVNSFGTRKLGSVTNELEHSLHDTDYANELYHTLLFLEFMIQLNRAAIHDNIHYISNSSSNEKVLTILDYLNSHLTEEITIDFLAKHFYLSRYYLMHTFKEETGYTIGSYLSTKRLLLAKDFIRNGMPITQACFECGFKNYSTFSRAYKKCFGESPRDLHAKDTPPV